MTISLVQSITLAWDMVRKAQILMMDLLEKNVGMQSRFLRPNVAKAKIRIGKKWHISCPHFNSLIEWICQIITKYYKKIIWHLPIHHSCIAYLISKICLYLYIVKQCNWYILVSFFSDPILASCISSQPFDHSPNKKLEVETWCRQAISDD